MMRRSLFVALLSLAACGPEARTNDGGLDATSMTMIEASVVRDASRPVSTVADRLAVMPVAYNPMSVPLGTVAGVAESGSTRAFFGSMGLRVVGSGPLLGSDPMNASWRGAASIPAGVASGRDGGTTAPWMVGIDGAGRVLRVRLDYRLEDVSDRYGVAMAPVRSIAHAGASLVGFWSDAQIAIANGETVMRYMRGPFVSFGAGAGLFAASTETVIEVLEPMSNTLRTYPLPGTNAVAVTELGQLVAAQRETIWTEASDGVIDPLFRAAEPVRALERSGGRVWFVTGTELGTVAGSRVALTQGLALPADARIQAGASGTIWVFAGAMAPKLYRVDEGMITPQQRWEETVLPVFSNRCGMCHDPARMGREAPLATFAVWMSRCADIRNRVVNPMDAGVTPMPPDRSSLTATDLMVINQWTMGCGR